MFLSTHPVGYTLFYLLQLTQLSSQLSTKISTIKKFPNQLYIERKLDNVCHIHSCYITDTCTERVTHFRIYSGRHMHQLECQFFKKDEETCDCVMKPGKLKATILTAKLKQEIDVPLSLKKRSFGATTALPQYCNLQINDLDASVPVDTAHESVSSDCPERTRRRITVCCRWEAVRGQLVNTTIEESSLPVERVCDCLAVARCVKIAFQGSIFVYFCLQEITG